MFSSLGFEIGFSVSVATGGIICGCYYFSSGNHFKEISGFKNVRHFAELEFSHHFN
jgi:hypothetical protein